MVNFKDTVRHCNFISVIEFGDFFQLLSHNRSCNCLSFQVSMEIWCMFWKGNLYLQTLCLPGKRTVPVAGFCQYCCCLIATTEIEPSCRAAYSDFPPKYRAGRKCIIQKNVLIVQLTFFSSKNIKHSIFSVMDNDKINFSILIILFFKKRLSVTDYILIVQKTRNS